MIKMLIICPGINKTEEQEFSDSIDLHFKKLGQETSISIDFECEAILYKIKYAEENQYDFFIIKSNKENPGCYSHSIIDNLLSNSCTVNTPKLLISNKPLPKRPTIINNNISYSPSKSIIQIRQQDARNPGLIKKIINSLIINQPVLYISYGNDEDNTSREIIKDFEDHAKHVLPHVKINHDMNQLKTGDNLQEFMEEMQNGSTILLLINRKYLKSEYCMQELIYIFKKLKGRIYPVFTDLKSGLHNRKGYLLTLEYWEQELHEINETMSFRKKRGLPDDKTLLQDKNLYSSIIKILPEFRLYIQEFFTLPIKAYQDQNYLDIYYKIHNDLVQEGHIKLFTDEDHLKETLNQP